MYLLIFRGMSVMSMKEFIVLTITRFPLDIELNHWVSFFHPQENGEQTDTDISRNLL